MKRRNGILFFLLLFCIALSGCYEINSASQFDYPAFYNKMEKKLPITYSMLPEPDSMETIEDLYLYYSDYDFIDSYYTIYLECAFTPEQFEIEKQRVIDNTSQYDFALYDSDMFSFDSVYINQCLEREPDGFIALQISYVLFDAENNKIIYVDIFEEGTKTELKSAYIPEKYLPQNAIGLVKQDN